MPPLKTREFSPRFFNKQNSQQRKTANMPTIESVQGRSGSRSPRTANASNADKLSSHSTVNTKQESVVFKRPFECVPRQIASSKGYNNSGTSMHGDHFPIPPGTADQKDLIERSQYLERNSTYRPEELLSSYGRKSIDFGQ